MLETFFFCSLLSFFEIFNVFPWKQISGKFKRAPARRVNLISNEKKSLAALQCRLRNLTAAGSVTCMHAHITCEVCRVTWRSKNSSSRKTSVLKVFSCSAVDNRIYVWSDVNNFGFSRRQKPSSKGSERRNNKPKKKEANFCVMRKREGIFFLLSTSQAWMPSMCIENCLVPVLFSASLMAMSSSTVGSERPFWFTL